MTLQGWVSAYGGGGKVARALGVTETAVFYWLKRKAVPRTETMARLVELSRGKLSFESIIRDTRKVSVKTVRA